MTVRMVALKSTRYRGRLYRQGDEFDAPVRVADLYRKLRRAMDVDVLREDAPASEPAPGASQSRALEAAQDGLTVEALRAEFQALTGTAPDRRWGEARLRSAIRDFQSGSRQPGVTAPAEPSRTGDLLC